MGRRGTGRWVALLVAVCAGALLPVQQAAVARAAEDPSPYVFARGAQRVAGAEELASASRLDAGSVYRSSIEGGRTLYYAVELDESSSAYVSAVAVPRSGTQVAYGDGLLVTLRNAEGQTCGSGQASFGSADYPAPLAVTASRLVEGGGTRCRQSGTYYVVVQRESADGSASAGWDLELSHVDEPPLEGGTASEPPAEARNPVVPPPPTGTAKGTEGGTGFNDARLLGHGVWQDRIRPGQALFYRVPLDWGQQLAARIELEGARSDGGGALGGLPKALHLSLHNPARTPVTSAGESYRGEPVTAALDALAPVAHENRLAAQPEAKEMRFPGSYYLKVTLDPKVAERYGDKALGLTLRVGVTGKPRTGVAYDGDAGIFRVAGDGTDAPVSGAGPAGGDVGDPSMKVVAAAGIGTGTLLVLFLALWTLLARRLAARRSAAEETVPRAAVDEGAEAVAYGPPRSW
ncbi:hypothetical protein [Streptomyces boluensis]|uniref:hypothetical protein n=1 Tax=Streptomyces boluensis TaxID=1775135 RepID=UPI0016524465|nr:hypothetical protein [Streptomyces boluensis]